MEILPYQEVLSSNWFLSIHIKSERFLAQLFKLLFKRVGKLSEESAGRNISRYGKNSLLKARLSKNFFIGSIGSCTFPLVHSLSLALQCVCCKHTNMTNSPKKLLDVLG